MKRVVAVGRAHSTGIATSRSSLRVTRVYVAPSSDQAESRFAVVYGPVGPSANISSAPTLSYCLTAIERDLSPKGAEL